MAVDEKISELTELTTLNNADLIPVVDSTTGVTKFVKPTNMGKAGTDSPLYTEQIYADGKLSNTHVSLSQALVTFNGNQYACVINSSDQLVLLKRAVGTKVWTTNVLTTKIITSPTDSHNTVTLDIDSAGILHIWYDHHASGIKYFRMPTAESIAGTPGANTSMTGTNESAFTYPGTFKDNAGALYCSYRSGSSGDGDLYIKKWNVGTQTWAGIPGGGTNGLVVLGSTLTPDENWYWSLPYHDTVNDVFYFSGMWRETGDEATNHDVSFLKYDVSTVTFKKADNSNYSMPIDLATIEIIDPVAQGQDLQSGVSAMWCTLATDGHPLTVYRKNDSNNDQQLFMSKWNGSTWSTPKQLTSGVGDWENNTAVNILRDANKTLYVLFGFLNYSDGLSVIETRDDFTTWNFYRIATTAGQVRQLRNIDWKLWNTSNILNLIFQHGIDRDYTYTRRPVELLHWEPLKGKTIQQDQIKSIWSYDDVDMRSVNGQFLFQCGDGVSGGSRKIKIYNANGSLEIGNGSGVAGRFGGNIKGLLSDVSAAQGFVATIDPADDTTTTTPMIEMTAKQSDETDMVNKPLFGIKNNTTYAYQVLADGSSDFQNEGIQNFILKFSNPITPPQITSNQNNYNPSGMSASSWLRLDTNASRDITGISAPTQQKFLLISNIGSFDIVLKSESASSTVANRFVQSSDTTISPGRGCIVVYDLTATRWYVFATVGGTGITDGDKGDITVSSSGTVWNIDSGAVGDAEIASHVSTKITGLPAQTQNLDLNSNKVTNLANPTAGGDAVNLTYFNAETEVVTGTPAAYMSIAKNATNTATEWTLLTTNHLGSALAAEIAANTAKVTNATHTGEATGSGALTLAASAITNRTQDELPDVDNDFLLCYDSSGTALSKVKPRDVAGDFAFLRQGYKRGVILCGTNDTKVSNGCLSFGTTSGTASGYISATGKALNFVSAGTTGSDAGERGIATSGHTRGDHSPLISAKFEIDANTNTRFFFGLANTTAALTGDTPLSALSGIAFVKKAGTNDLYLVTNDGTTAEEDDTTIDLADATPITLAIRTTDGGTTWQYSISSLSSGAWQTVSSAVLPAATTGLNFFIQVETSENVAKNLRLYGMGALFK